MIQSLGGTSPWVLFLGILGFIGAGFLMLSGVSTFFMFPLMESMGQTTPAMNEGGLFIGLALFYLAGGVMYAFLAYLLVRYYGAITRATRECSFEAVEAALLVHSRFWQISGISTIVMVALTIVFVVVRVAIALPK